MMDEDLKQAIKSRRGKTLSIKIGADEGGNLSVLEQEVEGEKEMEEADEMPFAEDEQEKLVMSEESFRPKSLGERVKMEAYKKLKK